MRSAEQPAWSIHTDGVDDYVNDGVGEDERRTFNVERSTLNVQRGVSLGDLGGLGGWLHSEPGGDEGGEFDGDAGEDDGDHGHEFDEDVQ